MPILVPNALLRLRLIACRGGGEYYALATDAYCIAHCGDVAISISLSPTYQLFGISSHKWNYSCKGSLFTGIEFPVLCSFAFMIEIDLRRVPLVLVELRMKSWYGVS